MTGETLVCLIFDGFGPFKIMSRTNFYTKVDEISNFIFKVKVNFSHKSVLPVEAPEYHCVLSVQDAALFEPELALKEDDGSNMKSSGHTNLHLHYLVLATDLRNFFKYFCRISAESYLS